MIKIVCMHVCVCVHIIMYVHVCMYVLLGLQLGFPSLRYSVEDFCMYSYASLLDEL